MANIETQARNIEINSEACTDCRLCELVCSLVKEGEVNAAKSRIHISSDRFSVNGKIIPQVCINCQECVAACPTEALKADPTTGVVNLDYNLCAECGDCIGACPYHAITKLPDGKILKCDLCNGSPACVEMCQPKAIRAVY